MRDFNPLLPLAALASLLLAALPLGATGQAAPENTAEPAPATGQTPAPAETPAADAPTTEAGAPATEAPAEGGVAAPPPIETPPPDAQVPTPVEGTRLLFLRLNLRIKRIEQEMLDAAPEPMLEHLTVAAELLAQLRARYLTDDEALRTDRAEQYLQELMQRYAERQAAAAQPAKPRGKRKQH